jgi:PPOX class probable FMN-dependent enzyme
MAVAVSSLLEQTSKIKEELAMAEGPSDYLTDRAQLRKIVGEVGPRVANKTIDHIDQICEDFIAASPYLIMATRGQDGLLDVSPKGDPAGFVAVLDRKTLAVPDRLGNGRFDSYENLIQDPSIALIFLIPGHTETLRVAGEAFISLNTELLAKFPVNGKDPRFVLIVKVREAFLHCSKSIVRAKLWDQNYRPDTSKVPSLAVAMVTHGQLALKVEDMQDLIDKDRENRLY